MKKSFFKKLSFVLALAMIVSTIAPAAGAFAAATPKINKSKVYLFLGQANEYDFSVKNKISGSTYKWSSSDTAVATVNKSGLTKGKAVGTATITVKVTAKKKTYTSKATVIVKNNIKTLTISNAPATVIAPGAEYDFNRSYTTQGGVTKTTSITKWVVTDAEGKVAADATIDKNGVFKATVAGTYKVTAAAFQSSAKYDTYVSTGDASLVLATDTVDVTVSPSIVDTKQVAKNKFTVEFDSDMSKTDVAKTAYLAKVVNGKDVTTGAEKFKSAELDAAGKVLTVETYSEFTAEATYNFVYGKLTDSFTAAKTGLELVTGLVATDFTDSTDNLTGVNVSTKVSGVNADGVIIATGSELSPYLTYEYKGDLAKGYVSGNTVNIYENGYVADVLVKYSNYVVDPETKAYKNVTASTTVKVTGVATSIDNSTIQFAVLDSAPGTSTTWGNTATVAAQDTGYQIYARYKNNTATATTGYTNATTEFIYESTNTDKLIITGTTLFPSKEGVVTVLVKNNDSKKAVVGSFELTISAKRSFGSAAVEKGTLTVGNTTYYADDFLSGKAKAITTTINVQDTLAKKFAPTVKSAEITAGPTGTQPKVYAEALGGNDTGKVKVYAYGGTGTTLGSYTAKIVLTGFGVDKEVYVAIIVLDGTGDNAAVARYSVELDATSVDLKAMDNTKDIAVSVYGYNAAGVRVDHLTTSEFDVVTKDAAGSSKSTSATIPVIGTSGTALKAFETGTYATTVTATGAAVTSAHPALSGKALGYFIGTATFTVTDTTSKSVVVVNPVVDYAASTLDSVYEAVMAAFDLTLNGDTISAANEVANITKIKFSKGGAITDVDTSVTAGTAIYVESIEYTVTNSSGKLTVYTYNVGTTITVK